MGQGIRLARWAGRAVAAVGIGVAALTGCAALRDLPLIPVSPAADPDPDVIAWLQLEFSALDCRSDTRVRELEVRVLELLDELEYVRSTRSVALADRESMRARMVLAEELATGYRQETAYLQAILEEYRSVE